jgi:hypothetical protein
MTDAEIEKVMQEFLTTIKDLMVSFATYKYMSGGADVARPGPLMGGPVTGRKILKRQTGFLANSVIANSRVDGNKIIMQTQVPYGVMWEVGSPETPGFIKEIVPNPARKGKPFRKADGTMGRRQTFLRFIGRDGKVVFTKRVPPRAIRPFLKPAVEEAIPLIGGMWKGFASRKFGAMFPTTQVKVKYVAPR